MWKIPRKQAVAYQTLEKKKAGKSKKNTWGKYTQGREKKRGLKRLHKVKENEVATSTNKNKNGRKERKKGEQEKRRVGKLNNEPEGGKARRNWDGIVGNL